MSWRLWNRETFCCCPEKNSRSSFGLHRHGAARTLPDLASSVDTLNTDASVEDESNGFAQSPHTDVVRPELTRRESGEDRARASQKHISPVELENLVVTITQNHALEPIDPMSMPALCSPPPVITPPIVKKDLVQSQELRPSEPQPIVKAKSSFQSSNIDSTNSATATSIAETSPTIPTSIGSASPKTDTHDVIRGFVPGGVPSSYRSQTQLAPMPVPILKTAPSRLPIHPKRKGAFFTLGTSSGEEESSMESAMNRGSVASRAESVHRRASGINTKKQASFKDSNLVSTIQDSPVFESDEEDEDEDDDDVIDEDSNASDWEDEAIEDDDDDDGDEPIFQRVDSKSKPPLTSRRSLLTSLMHEGDRARALQMSAARSAPARRYGPSSPEVAVQSNTTIAGLISEQTKVSGAVPINTGRTMSQPQPIPTMSPRTTRRTMLRAEMTESLRKDLMNERSFKTAQQAAVLKRRHTAHDMQNLRQFPNSKGPQSGAHALQAIESDDNFGSGLGEYHSKGW